jgi:hypothetical protein
MTSDARNFFTGARRLTFVRTPAAHGNGRSSPEQGLKRKETMTADILIGWVTIAVLVLIARGEYRPRRSYC